MLCRLYSCVTEAIQLCWLFEEAIQYSYVVEAIQSCCGGYTRSFTDNNTTPTKLFGVVLSSWLGCGNSNCYIHQTLKSSNSHVCLKLQPKNNWVLMKSKIDRVYAEIGPGKAGPLHAPDVVSDRVKCLACFLLLPLVNFGPPLCGKTWDHVLDKTPPHATTQDTWQKAD
jgi:hypothetical protein